MNYKIYKATENDIDTFFPFFEKDIQTKFPDYSENTKHFFINEGYAKEKLQNGISEKRFYLFLATKNEKIIGYLLAERVYGGVGFCNWIVVDEQYQGQGIGTALLQTWEKQALEKGAHKLHLWTDIRNVDFYKHQGFILLGKIPDDYYGTEKYFFYKTLRKSEEKNYLKDFLEKK